MTRRVVAVAVAIGAATARADDRPPVRLELAACLDAEREAIERAVRIELGDREDGPTAVQVRIECDAAGVDAGAVIEVRRPGIPRRYRYALDWHAQPADTRARLAGLAIAEAVDASQIELTAVAPPPPPTVAAVPVATPPEPAWTMTVVGSRREFADTAGVTLVGGGVAVGRELSPRLRLAIDGIAEGQTVLVSSGAIDVLSLSSAPRLVYRAGDRVHAELGAGVRAGIVVMHGETLGGDVVGQSLVRPWLGPMVTVAAGVALTPRIAVDAGLELGFAVTGATARELGQPATVLDGRWTSVGLGVAIAL